MRTLETFLTHTQNIGVCTVSCIHYLSSPELKIVQDTITILDFTI